MARGIRKVTLVNNLWQTAGKRVSTDDLPLNKKYDLRVCYKNSKTPEQIHEGLNCVEVLTTLDGTYMHARAYVRPSGRVS